ncbi:beta strand repeat-containing protein, partial [Chryseobacterium binzhouense]|uniref:beta strand repeat-containing protein n=1 Tax=Chryseobacterium binzhouense TaxID=2593646 RepID=UPI00289E0CB4
MKLKLHMKSKMLYAFLMALFSVWGWGQTPFVMANGNYSENFDDIANWTNNFSSGIGSAPWKTVATNTSGNLGDGIRVTTSTTFSAGSTGGIQKGTGNLVFLSTGTNNSVAADLYLNFSSRTAGTISFDAATIFNGSGNRDSVLKVFYSINNGSTFLELTGTNLPYTGRNNVVNNSTITANLPLAFNNLTNAIIRFYEYSTTGGGASPSGSQPKISIDNLSITSTAGNTPTIYTTTSTTLDNFSEVFGSSQTDVRSFSTNAENLTANLVVTPPANWEISLSPSSGFTTGVISLTPSSNNVAQTNIYVRLANGTPIGSYSGNITLSSTGAVAKNVAVSGNVNIGNPIATAATTVNNTSFNANWNAVSGANGYFIDVYKLVPTTISEGFDGGLTAPPSWIFTGLGIYTSGGNSTPSLRLDDTGDRILTPSYGNVKELKFWILGNGTNSTSPSSLLVEGFNGTSWITVDNITPIATTGTTYIYNSTTSAVLPSNLKQFRFTYTKNVGNIAFDDFAIITDQKSFATGFENKTLGNIQTTLVDNLTPATEYYYTIRSTNGAVTSLDSNVISVTTTSNTTWNGSTWSNGAPISTTDVIINGVYSTTLSPAFTAKNITIKNGGVLEINGTNTINATDVIVEDGGNLVIKDSGVLNHTGTFKVLKNGTSVQDKYAFWSSPVASQNLTAMYPGATPSFITEYNTATDYFVNAASTTSAFAKGYSIKTPAVSNAEFTGTPNNGTQTFTLSTAGNG